MLLLLATFPLSAEENAKHGRLTDQQIQIEREKLEIEKWKTWVAEAALESQ
jgi:hypothetical protein